MNQFEQDKQLGLTLADQADAFNIADHNLKTAWRYSKLRGLLIDNLRSDKRSIMVTPPDEYPRLRMYRGQGPHVELVFAVKCACGDCPPDSYHVAFTADYVHEDIDSMDEAEGCPGAPVKHVRVQVSMPRAILNNPSKKAFDGWARKFREKIVRRARAEAVDAIDQLRKKHNL